MRVVAIGGDGGAVAGRVLREGKEGEGSSDVKRSGGG
jgi:hypothetical protein